MPDSTQQLVEHASRGDARAIEELLERFLPDLRRFIQLHAGPLVGARESSSDLAQSVCREILERLGTERFVYRGESEFKSWLCNAAVFKIRARQRFYLAAMRDVGRDDPQSSDALAAGSDESPSGAAALNEEVERVRAALTKLAPRYREVIQLAHVEGLTHQQIGERLGISETNSRVLLSRAMARLATLGVRTE